MTISLSNITGSAQTGLTTPGFNVLADSPPVGKRGKQWAVSQLTGTQTGVEPNTIGNPFTLTYFGPENPKGTPVLNANGAPVSVPRNQHRILTRKGQEVVAGYRFPGSIDTVVNVPAGAEIKDPESVRAMLSAHIGALSQMSAALGDTLIDGTM